MNPPAGTKVITPADFVIRKLPRPGEQFGRYRIVRELGRGGMGAAFEAEDCESGRRLALKVLGQQLDSPDARKRFLREGRLAASINHPNSVYVYGTEEIDGTPAITMELVSGGTLQERVQRQGPMPVGDAVTAILEVIAGLEAAQAIGILHRDVKPSNCFQDADGTTKIGDFGLSISTSARGETDITVSGAFLGTPAFCSPEQLRGEELNARSDIYSVGVTLYYLLTGRTPFEGKSLVQLLATVLEKPAPSPRRLNADIPHGLAKIITRCLAKQAGERHRDYNELRQALAPYSPTATTPATVSLRIAAGLVDMVLLTFVATAMQWPLWGSADNFLDSASNHPRKVLLTLCSAATLATLYFGVLEGLWGASVGKFMCGLRVVGRDRNVPGIPRALTRAFIYEVLPVLPFWLSIGFDPLRLLGGEGHFSSVSRGVILLILFSTMRRRNGFAAIHDLVTGTRVILKTAYFSRPVLQSAGEPPPKTPESGPAIGPYHFLESLGNSAGCQWILGYHPRLLRREWIRVVPAGTPALEQKLRGLGRVGRLRWIGGRRAETENWDAFEAAAGKPLIELARQPQPWNQVRFWLYDLAKEGVAALKDGTMPADLSLDRVWITVDGRAKLLDFPAPGTERDSGAPLGLTQAPGAVEATRDAQAAYSAFLSRVARAALDGNVAEATSEDRRTPAPPLPLHAREFMEKLALSNVEGLPPSSVEGLPHGKAGDPPLNNVERLSPEAIVDQLTPLLQKLAIVSRRRRLGIIGGCAFFPMLVVIGVMLGTRLATSHGPANEQTLRLNEVWEAREAARQSKDAKPDDRQYAIYIASHFRPMITNAATWSNLFTRLTISQEGRKFAEQSVAEHPAPTAAEVEQAEAALKDAKPHDDNSKSPPPQWVPLLAAWVVLLIYVAIPALIAAFAFRGGLVLRVAGLAVVNRRGAPAGRWQTLVRCALAWTPFFLVTIPFFFTPPSAVKWTVAAVGLLLSALISLSIALPNRGLPDRLAGTWLVPR